MQKLGGQPGIDQPYTQTGDALIIRAVKCIEWEHCKSREEVDEFITYNFIKIQYNQQKYNEHNYDEDVIVNRRQSTLYPISKDEPLIITNKVQKQSLQQKIAKYDADLFGKDELEWYYVDSNYDYRRYPLFSPDDTFTIFFQLHPEEILHEREVYNILDLIGDIGGLLEGLNWVASLSIYCFGNFNSS